MGAASCPSPSQPFAGHCDISVGGPLSALPGAPHTPSLWSPQTAARRAARRDAAGVARGRCGAGEEGASQGGERREEAPGRSRGRQLRPSRAHSVAARVPSLAAPWGARATSVSSSSWSRRPGIHSWLPPTTSGAVVRFPSGLGVRGSPSCRPPPRPLRERSVPRPAAGGGGGGGGIAARAGLATSPRAPPLRALPSGRATFGLGK